MEEISVYWTRGCSNCVNVKFLTKNGVSFESVNVAERPAGKKFLASLGVRPLASAVLGREFTFAKPLGDVARFVGIGHTADRLRRPEGFRD